MESLYFSYPCAPPQENKERRGNVLVEHDAGAHQELREVLHVDALVRVPLEVDAAVAQEVDGPAGLLSAGLLNVFKIDDSPRVCQECLRKTCMLYTP